MESEILSEAEKLYAEATDKCAKYYGLPSESDCLATALHDAKKKKTEMKSKYLELLESLFLMCELNKPMDHWSTTFMSEKEMPESDEPLNKAVSLYNKRISELEETAKLATEAIDTLKEKLTLLSEKKCQLEKKYVKMREKNPSLVSAVNIQTHSDDVKTDTEKVKLLLQSVTRQHDLLQDRLNRLENNLQRQQSEIIETKKEEATCNSCLAKIKARLEDVVNLSGIRCQVKDEKTVQVEFLSPLEKIEEESPSDKSRLIILLEVCEDHLGFLQLTNVKINQMICGSESIIEAALADKDVPKLILELKTLWLSQVPLITEIQQLRKKHAIDWIPEKNILYLMVKNSCSVVCTLTVPSQYPAGGAITLESIMGPSNEITVEDVKPPTETTLTAWISHLENLPWKRSL